MTDPRYSTQLSQFLPTATGHSEPTMSSVDIAELTGKRHDHVMRDIRKMLDGLKSEPVGGLPNFGGTYTDSQGKGQSCFNLPKRECLILVSGYSVELRAKVIDRWMELEQGAAQPSAIDFSDPAVLLGVVGHLQSTVSSQAQQIAAMAPAVEALEQIAEAHGSMCRTEAAKHLGVPPHTLCKWLRTNMWTYRRAGTKDDLAYQAKINAGYLEHKVTTGPRPDGTEWIGTQVRITPRGLTVLAIAFPKAAEPAVVSALRSHLAKVA